MIRLAVSDCTTKPTRSPPSWPTWPRTAGGIRRGAEMTAHYHDSQRPTAVSCRRLKIPTSNRPADRGHGEPVRRGGRRLRRSRRQMSGCSPAPPVGRGAALPARSVRRRRHPLRRPGHRGLDPLDRRSGHPDRVGPRHARQRRPPAGRRVDVLLGYQTNPHVDPRTGHEVPWAAGRRHPYRRASGDRGRTDPAGGDHRPAGHLDRRCSTCCASPSRRGRARHDRRVGDRGLPLRRRPHMGMAVVATPDEAATRAAARRVAAAVWDRRRDLQGGAVSVEAAVAALRARDGAEAAPRAGCRRQHRRRRAWRLDRPACRDPRRGHPRRRVHPVRPGRRRSAQNRRRRRPGDRHGRRARRRAGRPSGHARRGHRRTARRPVPSRKRPCTAASGSSTAARWWRSAPTTARRSC